MVFYDVIVVGSGPAGSTAAAMLAQGDRSVLIVDRECFPRAKVCGDLIGPRAFTVLQRLGLADQILRNGFFPFAQAHLIALGGGVLAIDFRKRGLPFGTIDRLTLDTQLHAHALACGAAYQHMHIRHVDAFDGTRMHLHGEHDGQEVTLATRVVIGADGASSLVARALGWTQPTPAHCGVAIRGYTTSRAANAPCAEFSFLHGLLPGYAWFLPAGDRTVNVGVGMRTDYYRRSDRDLRTLLHDFLALPRIRERIEPDSLTNVGTWTLNLGSHQASRVFDGAVLVGDAGAFIDPLVGSGIHTAMLTGQLAAEVVLEALQTGDITRRGLAVFDQRWRQCLEQDFRVAHLVQQVVTAMPGLIDLAAMLLPGDSDVVQFFVGKF